MTTAVAPSAATTSAPRPTAARSAGRCRRETIILHPRHVHGVASRLLCLTAGMPRQGTPCSSSGRPRCQEGSVRLLHDPTSPAVGVAGDDFLPKSIASNDQLPAPTRPSSAKIWAPSKSSSSATVRFPGRTAPWARREATGRKPAPIGAMENEAPAAPSEPEAGALLLWP